MWPFNGWLRRWQEADDEAAATAKQIADQLVECSKTVISELRREPDSDYQLEAILESRIPDEFRRRGYGLISSRLLTVKVSQSDTKGEVHYHLEYSGRPSPIPESMTRKSWQQTP